MELHEKQEWLKDYFTENNFQKPYISAAPVIIETYTYNDSLPTFSVIYFAKPLPNVPQWFKYSKLLLNSSRYSIRNIKKNISFEIYGKITQETVYSSNLSTDDKIPGTYSVMVSNEYGQVRTTFNWKSGN